MQPTVILFEGASSPNNLEGKMKGVTVDAARSFKTLLRWIVELGFILNYDLIYASNATHQKRISLAYWKARKLKKYCKLNAKACTTPMAQRTTISNCAFETLSANVTRLSHSPLDPSSNRQKAIIFR